GRRPFMTYKKAWTMILIEDGRGPQIQTHQYEDGAAALYEYCADARTAKEISTMFGDQPWVQEALDEFVEKWLMLHLDGRYLSLALPHNRFFDLERSPAAQPSFASA
ncbi:MAG TPA: hypothetical protein VFR08_07935, partial [Candidatus Angelobacter sp.]|nr:hypothetical protein [Candidatus Angelobacter sp.]